ncbi:hypothetical protein EMU01_25880 [Enterococcus mundtii]|uniref:Uncharacterized protein n=1 Tax=Enterococcus mundtii TaxID=53346 RepID=A0ABQ0VFL1_ENTMU|nr:hypothetical protein EMU01_25880 [Enterococcus mundtii]
MIILFQKILPTISITANIRNIIYLLLKAVGTANLFIWETIFCGRTNNEIKKNNNVRQTKTKLFLFIG